jgi:ubiquinone/menaquinone biosynthesis C-methylase UbiE
MSRSHPFANRTTETRLRSETEYSDVRYAENTRARADKFYLVTGESNEFYRSRVLEDVSDKRVLEYGCGTGSAAFDIGRLGGRAVGIDISPVAISLATKQAQEQGIADNVEFVVMNAEKLQFPDASFDRVCGSGIIHHLDIGRALPEIARVLRPGGRAVFTEPLGHNPVINAYRRLTPELRTVDEHPLLRKDIKQIEAAREHFPTVRTRYFHLSALAAVPLRNTRAFRLVNGSLDRLDHILLRPRTPLRWWSWFVVIELNT